MAEPDRLVGDIRHALATLDTHFGMALRCPPADLRRSGWHVLVARHTMDDPTALLFGRRQRNLDAIARPFEFHSAIHPLHSARSLAWLL